MQSVLTQAKQSKIAFFKPCDRLNAANAEGFRQQVLTAIASDQHTAVLIDMSQVESMDSAGLMALVSVLTQAQQQNQRLGLCEVSSSVRIIFELTQLDRVFEFYENRAAFMAA